MLGIKACVVRTYLVNHVTDQTFHFIILQHLSFFAILDLTLPDAYRSAELIDPDPRPPVPGFVNSSSEIYLP